MSDTKQISFLNKIWKKTSSLCKGHLIICRDFSAILNTDLDISKDTCHRKRRAMLNNFISSSDQFDVWRCKHSIERDITFFPMFTIRTHVSIYFSGHIFVTENHQIWHSLYHVDAPISITVGEIQTETRANRWRNKIYTRCPNQKTRNSSADDPFTLWNSHKVHIRGLLIQLSTKMKWHRKRRFNDLIASIKQLEQNYNKKYTQWGH